MFSVYIYLYKSHCIVHLVHRENKLLVVYIFGGTCGVMKNSSIHKYDLCPIPRTRDTVDISQYTQSSRLISCGRYTKFSVCCCRGYTKIFLLILNIRHNCEMAPSVLDKIITVIKDQNTPGGSSRPALSKGLKAKFGEVPAAAVKTAIKKGVDSGKLVQSGQKFWVAGHEPPPPPAEVSKFNTRECRKRLSV